MGNMYYIAPASVHILWGRVKIGTPTNVDMCKETKVKSTT